MEFQFLKVGSDMYHWGGTAVTSPKSSVINGWRDVGSVDKHGQVIQRHNFSSTGISHPADRSLRHDVVPAHVSASLIRFSCDISTFWLSRVVPSEHLIGLPGRYWRLDWYCELDETRSFHLALCVGLLVTVKPLPFADYRRLRHTAL